MKPQLHITSRRLLFLTLFILAWLALPVLVAAQNETTGAFQGEVSDAATGSPVSGARVQFTYSVNGVQNAKITDSSGRFYQGLLGPGIYRITISKQGYKSQELERVVFATQSNTIIPVPVKLEPEMLVSTPAPTPTPIAGTTPGPTPEPLKTGTVPGKEDFRIGINTTDGRRGGAFTDKEVSTLPLGGITLTRTFDELALLLAGVALPPQTLGNIAGPGVGAGVGSAGQFSVNGLRSRANNFTVDGSDNNDEDIGVRRQGFFSLVPQPIESIQEYQVTTLLAPAQYGRNIGAQVNAVSKSGGNETHGTIFGFFNSSQLNARNFFDNTSGNTRIPLQGRALNPDGSLGAFRDVFVDGTRKFVSNNAGREDSFTLGQGGLVIGGPLIPSDAARPGRSAFYFISMEGQLLNATQESNFAVPTVEERGLLRSGASGISVDPFGNPTFAFPTTVAGDAVFSLFPFPNNPNGIYGRNTFTQALPSSGQGKILSGKVDGNFRAFNRPQQLTARYNFTDDWRDIPVTGGAIFSTLRPRVRTQNFSTFLNTELSGPDSTTSIYNQLRLSYGRTRLIFDEVRDTEFLRPSEFAAGLPPDQQAFLLNAPTLVNFTLPNNCFSAPGVCVDYFTDNSVERVINRSGSGRLAPIGQINIAGFSPVGVDVFNFPQRRVNNTYQLADIVTMRLGSHNIAFGADIRRTELNSDLPRNARPLLTFNGAPDLLDNLPGRDFFSGADFTAASAPSGVFQSLSLGGGSAINLRYYQLNFFGQDEWRIRRNLSLSFGLRYEHNTVPREVNNRIETTFRGPFPDIVSGISTFIGGRTRIFEDDRNNFAPRIGIAYSPRLFGADRITVFRAGAGVYFDQILGAVTSQSRNVFPNFLNVNFGGGLSTGVGDLGEFNIFTPGTAFITCPDGMGFRTLVQDGTLNTLNPAVPLSCFTAAIANSFEGGFPFTLPTRELETPTAYHYSFTFEQQLSSNLVASASYVGTQGRHLLRQTTPNLGSNAILFPIAVFVPPPPDDPVPTVFGFTVEPGLNGRPISNVGGVTIFTSDANSRYDALQLELRGRYHLLGSTQFQVNYTFSKTEDDVSDVFDLAGAPALPQNSLTFAGERGAANFDARHRFSYSYVTDLPTPGADRSPFFRFLFGGIQLAGTGMFQTGQPFTVNSIFDVNLDGNLTDRLNTTNGITATGDRQQPLRLTNNSPAFLTSLLARPGEDGSVGRNTFRSGNVWLTNFTFVKKFTITENQNLQFRMDVYNLFNRANFGIPVRFLEAPGFGQATETVTPGRRIQFALKYSF
jgi:hypothetical protein